MTLENALAKIAALEAENQQLKEQLRVKNQRNAGRKKADQKWVASYVTFCELYDAGSSKVAIQKQMGISDATFYRYQKLKRDTDLTTPSD